MRLASVNLSFVREVKASSVMRGDVTFFMLWFMVCSFDPLATMFYDEPDSWFLPFMINFP